MKKIFTLISMICLCAFNAMAAEVTTVTDIEKAVTDGTVVTISINGTYLYGPDAQNTKMGTAEEAVSSSNGCVGYKIEKDGDNYMFRCVTPDGGDYFIWGRTECNYLNAQPNVDGVTFNYWREYAVYKVCEYLREKSPEAEIECNLCGNDSYISISISDEEQKQLNVVMNNFLKTVR